MCIYVNFNKHRLSGFKKISVKEISLGFPQTALEEPDKRSGGGGITL
jgi:hypothetical protein